MSDERRKITLYLHPNDSASDAQAYNAIQEVSSRTRGDFFRQALITGIALSKIDNRLPSVITALFDREMDATALAKLLGLINPRIAHPNHDSSNNTVSSSLRAVAWQRRSRDALHVDRPWSGWFPITESDFKSLSQEPVADTQVRALLADEPTQETAPILDVKDARKELAEKAKKAMG